MKITIIGAGNMGGAIAHGVVAKGVCGPGELTLADPRPDLSQQLNSAGYDVIYNPDNAAAVKGADLIVIAVKPWLMEQVLGGISPSLVREDQAIVSVAAGVTFADISTYINAEGFGSMAMYRVIPNTAAAIGKSVTFISSFNTGAQADSMVMDVFRTLGTVYEVPEDNMPAVTALASSGIAYALKYIDAASNGGAMMGLDERRSLEIVLGTVEGAVALLRERGTWPQEEIDKVTTPGGITQKGLAAMEESGFVQSVIKGLLATK